MTSSDSCILAVDAGGTSLKAALVREHSVLEGSFFSIPVRSDGSKEEIQDSYRRLSQTAGRMASERSAAIRRVSVCIPGPFDYAGGRCLMTHKYQSVYGESMRPWIWDGLGAELPVGFLHDSTAFLLGAVSSLGFSPHFPRRRICAVIIGTGLGFASMIDGSVLLNDSGGPGISIYRRPFRGGIAEDYVSRRGILKRYQELRRPESGQDAPPLDVKDIAQLAAKGDPSARQVFLETGECLADILRPIILEQGFELLLLGGAISKSADLFLPSLTAGLAGTPAVILPTDNLDHLALLGAAEYQFF